MTLKAALSRLSRKSMPAVATNMPFDSWLHQLRIHPPRFVRKVELCTALAAGPDRWHAPVDRAHFHTILRIFLAPVDGGPSVSEDILLVERVISTGGSYHSVVPVPEKFSTGGTLTHPDIHDRVSVMVDGPSTALARHLVVERTLKFGDGSCNPHLPLCHFAQILEFVSRTTMLICAGGDCKFQSRSFAFICMAALTPRLPPRAKAGEGVGVDAGHGAELVDDTVFELGAETFLGQVPWLVRDSASTKAIRLIGAIKEEPRAKMKTRLYH